MEYLWFVQCFTLALALTTRSTGWKILFYAMSTPILIVLLPVIVAFAVIKLVKGVANAARPKGRDELVGLYTKYKAERIMNPQSDEDRAYAKEFLGKVTTDTLLKAADV